MLTLCSKMLILRQTRQCFQLRSFHKTSHNFIEMSNETFRAKTRKKIIGPLGWFLLVVPASTFALGTWQVQRKKWKENLMRDLSERGKSQPRHLPNSLDEIEKLEYHTVHVRGEFLHDKEIHMGPRTLLEHGDASTSSALLSSNQNKSQGYLVITPFKLDDRDETILVNRGWVPAKLKDPKKRKMGQIEGTTDVIGVVRLHENRPNFMPANREDSNSWFYRDLKQMSALTGASEIFIDATTDYQQEHGPIGGQTRISLRNEHLSYILTWYSLSIATSFMWYKHFLK